MRTSSRAGYLRERWEASTTPAHWAYTALPISIGVAAVGLVATGHSSVALIALVLGIGTTQIGNPCGVAHTCALTRHVHDSDSMRRWLKGIVPYTLGGCLSGAVVGGLLGVLGLGVRTVIPNHLLTAVVIVLGILAVARDTGLVRIRIPEVKRQTRALWSRTSFTTNALLWGIDVGATFLTWQMYAGAYVLAAIVVAIGSPAIGAMLFANYWLGRALPHWIEPFILDDPERPFLEIPAIGELRARLGSIHAVLLAIGLVVFLQFLT